MASQILVVLSSKSEGGGYGDLRRTERPWMRMPSGELRCVSNDGYVELLLGKEGKLADQLNAEQIVAWCNASWDLEVRPAFVGNHAVNAPCPARRVKTILPYLEPL